FLSFESERGGEAASLIFIAAALLGAAIWIISTARSVRAVIRSHYFVSGSGTFLAGTGSNSSEAIWFLEGAGPFIGLAGVFRPRVIASHSVKQALNGDQFAAAIRHE